VPTSNDRVHRNGPRIPEPVRWQITSHNKLPDALGRHSQDARRIRE
jgi:hypothetical protein